jgi:hypothetical protein
MSDLPISPDLREFHCSHCNGKIRIPRNLPSTTGPCPHCGGTITSPAPEPVVTQPEPFVFPQSPPESPAQPTVTQAAAVQPQPEPAAAERAPVEYRQAPEPEAETFEQDPPSSKKGIAVAIALLLILGAAAAAYLSYEKFAPKVIDPPANVSTPPESKLQENHYLRLGWQKEALEVLTGFLAAKTVDEKLPFVLGAPAVKERMENFYGGVVINDSDTPASSFSPFALAEEDNKRGLFLMNFDQPPQADIREFFRPLATFEVQFGLDQADMLLSTMAQPANFIMEPLRVQAFFKRTPDGLKLDWDIFAQTKYRRFRNFIELPEQGAKETFRVILSEDVPDKGVDLSKSRTYRVTDPINATDFARINIKDDTELSSTLHVLNWRNDKEARQSFRTATVELRWTPTDPPVLEISKFICWEFLGLGAESPASAGQ